MPVLRYYQSTEHSNSSQVRNAKMSRAYGDGCLFQVLAGFLLLVVTPLLLSVPVLAALSAISSVVVFFYGSYRARKD